MTASFSKDAIGSYVPIAETYTTTRNLILTERALLKALDYPQPAIDAASRKAIANQTSVETELLAGEDVTADDYYSRFATYLGLPFATSFSPFRLIDRPNLDTQIVKPTAIRLEGRSGESRIAIIPSATRAEALQRTLQHFPDLRERIVVTTPAALCNAVWQAGEKRRTYRAINRLITWNPQFSARVVFWGKQGFLIGSLLAALCALLAAFPATTLIALHVVFSAFYFCSLIFRAAAMTIDAPPLEAAPPPRDGNLPVYTVMVALYREAGMIDQLTGALLALDWPRTKLDIKLVCEADDHETIAAIKAGQLPACFELVCVPPSLPRTKPKALSYALSGARGEFLTLYDAEDRPHPQQLRAAYQTFSHASKRLACLQAPLDITNGAHSWLCGLFAREYAALFRGILPLLARSALPLPLGGTSNHFRTDALRAARAWDPFNVTEDADLGLRLHRLGYRCGVIGPATLEDAPTSLRSWTGQRTRWFKGWLQTFLVATRDPVALWRELGANAFMIFMLNSGGMLVSALLHPIVFLALAVNLALIASGGFTTNLLHITLTAVDLANIVLSYVVFLRLGQKNLTPEQARTLKGGLLQVPLYWLFLSFAAWQAAIELVHRPFHWKKTEHRPVTPD
ncbi:glycosyltransferase [Martelella sp. HB161492]|uniref:glycosyltransferase n=1 Tax=Martelella sp. HB161492 TaxID=2720726 RepID=UPI0015906B68|nr:glycosyltransferase [Martelella sp. HB161492]